MRYQLLDPVALLSKAREKSWIWMMSGRSTLLINLIIPQKLCHKTLLTKKVPDCAAKTATKLLRTMTFLKRDSRNLLWREDSVVEAGRVGTVIG